MVPTLSEHCANALVALRRFDWDAVFALHRRFLGAGFALGGCVLAGCNGGPQGPALEAGAAEAPDRGSHAQASRGVDASAPVPGAWRVLFDDLEGPVLSVWGTSLERVFFVGEGGLALERDGRRWWQWSLPTDEALWWVWGRSETDVFAGGEGGTLLHFDGAGWARLDAGLDPRETIWGIWGDGEVTWAVGGRASTHGPGFVLRSDGERWHRVNVGAAPNLYKIWGNGEELFVVGDDSSLYRLSDERLEEEALGPLGDNSEPLFTLSGNRAGAVFAVGGVSQGLAFERGARGFELVPFATGGLNGVSVTDDGRVTVVGLSGVIRERSDGEWRTHDLAPARHYHATCAFADGAYAVGGDLLSSGAARRGLIAVRGDDETTAPPELRPREPSTASDAGVRDASAQDAATEDASSLREAGAPGFGVADGATTAATDAGTGGPAKPSTDAAAPVPLDAGDPADAGGAPIDAGGSDPGSGLPGASEPCTDDFRCAPGLECWYIQGESELRCVQMCETAEECAPEFGPDAQCAPPGCQTVLGACLRAEWVGCL